MGNLDHFIVLSILQEFHIKKVFVYVYRHEEVKRGFLIYAGISENWPHVNSSCRERKTNHS